MQRSVQDPSPDVWSPTSAQLALISAGLSDLEALIEEKLCARLEWVDQRGVDPATAHMCSTCTGPSGLLVQIANKHPGGRHQGHITLKIYRMEKHG